MAASSGVTTVARSGSMTRSTSTSNLSGSWTPNGSADAEMTISSTPSRSNARCVRSPDPACPTTCRRTTTLGVAVHRAAGEPRARARTRPARPPRPRRPTSRAPPTVAASPDRDRRRKHAAPNAGHTSPRPRATPRSTRRRGAPRGAATAARPCRRPRPGWSVHRRRQDGRYATSRSDRRGSRSPPNSAYTTSRASSSAANRSPIDPNR